MREASGGVRYVYGRWAHMAVRPPNPFKVKRIRTSNKRVSIPFAVIIFLIKGKMVNP
jgi:hypothetical protein